MSVIGDETRANRLASDIADAIVAGEYGPGTKLDEQMIAGRYGVSRTPVREALRILGAGGLVEHRPRRGAVVAQVTAARLEELFVAMAEIEASCARLATLGMSPVERRRLAALHDEMHDLARLDDHEAYSNANTRFHAAIYAGTHNDPMIEIAHGLRRRLAPYRRAQFRTPGRLVLSHEEHGAVVDAVLAGKAAEAHAAMLHHVALVESAVELLAGR